MPTKRSCLLSRSFAICLVGVLLLSSGCYTFSPDWDGHEHGHVTPSRSFFQTATTGAVYGVEASFELGPGLFILGGAPGAVIALPAIGLGATVGMLIGLPVDIVRLPYNLYGVAKFAVAPPLGYCIYQGDLQRLKARLEAGVDPNQVYSRWGGWKLPLYEAIVHDNAEAFDLLLQHGAKVTPAMARIFLGQDTYHVNYASLTDSEMHRKMMLTSLRKDLTPFRALKKTEKDIPDYIFDWYGNASLPEEEQDEILLLLLAAGFNPNECHWRADVDHDMGSSVEAAMTFLDRILFNYMLPRERREKLIVALRQHGALTYSELRKWDPENYGQQDYSQVNFIGWIGKKYSFNGKTYEKMECLDDVSLFLAERYPKTVNQIMEQEFRQGSARFSREMTALDLIRRSGCLSPERRERLVTRLRELGAREYLEGVKEGIFEKAKPKYGIDDFCRDSVFSYSWRHGNREMSLASWEEYLEYLLCCGKEPNGILEGERLPGWMSLPGRYRYPDSYPMTALDVVRLCPDFTPECRERLIALLKEHDGKGYVELVAESNGKESPMMHLCRQIYNDRVRTLPAEVKELFYRYLEVRFPLNADSVEMDLTKGVWGWGQSKCAVPSRKIHCNGLDLIHLSNLEDETKRELEEALREHGALSYYSVHPDAK